MSRSATATPGPSPPSTHDGSITVSHQGGHGDVTLPADYVRDHVRLGYAATEHGWQSDTVDTAIALASPATTRRGLYVAATRGRDTNTLCVVTDSDDVAEARDVLEAILAADRADIPATTQRRTLAARHPRTRPRPPQPTDAALRDPRLVLRRRWPTPTAASATPRPARRSAHSARPRRTPRSPTPTRVAADVAAATAADRDALQSRRSPRRRRTATTDRRSSPARQRAPPPTPQPSRRPRRRRATTRSSRDLPRTHPATSRPGSRAPRQPPSRTSAPPRQHVQAVSQMDATPPVIGQHRLHIQALNTWKHWAEGHDVPDGALRTTAAVLAQQARAGAAAGHHRSATTSRPRPVEPSARSLSREPDAHVHIQQPDFGIER